VEKSNTSLYAMEDWFDRDATSNEPSVTSEQGLPGGSVRLVAV